LKLILGLIVLAIIVYFLYYNRESNWTGFKSKTLWDRAELLLVPILIAIGGWAFTMMQDKSNVRTEKENFQQSFLENYLNVITELMLDGKLRESDKDSEIRNIARARTINFFNTADNSRAGLILQFLYESNLINSPKPLIDLTGIELMNKDFSNIQLIGVKITGAHFNGTNFKNANLKNSDFSSTNFNNCNLNNTKLNKTNFKYADMANVKLENVNLDDTNLEGVEFKNGSLKNSTIRNKQLWDKQIRVLKYKPKNKKKWAVNVVVAKDQDQ